MYDYQAQRKFVFTEEGQVMFLKIRDKARQLIKLAGCVRSGELMDSVSGSTWDMLACIDRLCELNEILEITTDKVAGQNRIFVAHNENWLKP